MTLDELSAQLAAARPHLGGGARVVFYIDRERVETTYESSGIYFEPVPCPTHDTYGLDAFGPVFTMDVAVEEAAPPPEG